MRVGFGISFMIVLRINFWI